MKSAKVLFMIVFFVLAGLFLSPGCGNDETAELDCEDAFCIGVILHQHDARSSVIKAVELARDDINKAGGNVKLIMGDVDPTLASAKKLREMGARAIIGPPSSGRSVEIFDFVVENSLVTVSPSATSVTLTEENRKISSAGKTPFFFRTVPNDSFQAKILASLAKDEVLIVHRSDDYGKKLTELISGEMPSLGRPEPTKVVKYDEWSLDDPDSDSKARKVLDDIEAVDGISDVDSIILILSAQGDRNIVKAMLDSSVVPSSAEYFISDSLAFADLAEQVDPDNPAVVEGFKGTTPCGLPDPPERNDEFEKRFDSEKHRNLQFAAHAYDATVTVALAALSAGSADPSIYVSEMAKVTRDGTPCLTYAQCSAALTDETIANDDIDYEGISGPIDFDENGDITKGCFSVLTYGADGGTTTEMFDIPLRD